MNSPPQQGRGRKRGGARTPARRIEARSERAEQRVERFAGSKWGTPPAAEALPPPPTHWRRCRPEIDRALPLKLLLNVSVAAS